MEVKLSFDLDSVVKSAVSGHWSTGSPRSQHHERYTERYTSTTEYEGGGVQRVPHEGWPAVNFMC